MEYFITLFIISFVYLDIKYLRSDIVTLCVIAHFLFFFLYGYVDVYNEIIDLNLNYIIANILIFSSLVLILLIYVPFRAKLKYFSAKFIVNTCNDVHYRVVVLCFLVISLIVIFYYVKTGFIFQVNPLHMEALESKLDRNLYTSFRNLFFIPIYSMLSLIIFVQLINKRYKRNYFFNLIYILILSLMLLYLLFCGRKIFLYIIVILSIYYYSLRSIKVNIKNVIIAISLVFIMVMASNFYQNMRTENLRVMFFTGEILSKKTGGKEISTMLLDIDSSSSNLKLRESPLNLVVDVIASQIDQAYSPSYGAISSQVLLNSIPGIIYPSKNAIGEDFLISKYSGIIGSDLPTNVYAMLFVDFGFFVVILYISVIMFVLFIFHFLLKNTIKNKLLFLYLYILLTITMFQLENGLGHTVLMIRNAVLITVVYKLIISLKLLLIPHIKK